MALVIADRVKETTTTTGTGAITLAGAVATFQTFVAGIGHGNTCYYAITSGSNWEIGLGTVTDSPDTLSRTTILDSSAHTATLTFGDTEFDDVNNGTVTLIDNAGLSKTYVIRNDYGATGATEFNAGGSRGVAAANLAQVVESSNGHNGTIYAMDSSNVRFSSGGYDFSDGVVNFKQATSGKNTTITTAASFDDTTDVNIGSAFTDSHITLSGTSTVFATYPGPKSVHLDASGNLSHTVDISSDTNLVGGTNITLSGDTLNVDDAFLVNDASDTTTGTITAGGFTTTGTWTFDESTSGTIGITTIQDSGSSFSDNDTSLMTSAAILDKIQATGGSVSDIDDLGDVSFGGTNLTRTLLIGTGGPGETPPTGTVSSAMDNIGIGYLALEALTQGDSNVCIGPYAGTDILAGSDNVLIGKQAGYKLTSALKNIAIGYTTMSAGIVTGSNNIALGQSALDDVTSGYGNVGIGQKAAESQATGYNNVAVGANALRFNAAGNSNIAIGSGAMYGSDGSTTGSHNNTAVGMGAGYGITTGDTNIFIGYEAGYALTTSSDMLYIANAKESSNGTLIKGDMANKFLAVGKADVTLATEDATLQVYPTATNDSAYFAKMPGSHTGDLIRIENSSGTALFKVDKDGDLTANSITVSESPVVPYTAITGDTTVTTSNVVVFANATSGEIDVTLYLAASNGGRTLTIKKTDSSANAVNILRAGSETIDGATSLSLTVQYQSYTLISDNTNWSII